MKKSKKQAFTLIELLVVVLIIGILAAVALPQYQAVVDKRRFSTVLPIVKSISDAQEVYYLANGQYSSAENLDVEKPGSLPENIFYEIDTGSTNGLYLDNEGNRIAAYVMYHVHTMIKMKDISVAGKRYCFSYNTLKRGDKICKSLGGTLVLEKSNVCGQTCNVYQLP